MDQLHKNCKIIFEQKLFPENESPSIACRIYDKMAQGNEAENCLGENFNQALFRIKDNWFNEGNIYPDYEYYFQNYILQFYLLYERIEFVFAVINPDKKNKLFRDFLHTKLKTLMLVSKWANFIKHPKEYFFCHWPEYLIEGDDEVKNISGVKIDKDFILKHYKSSNCDRPDILENNRKVCVVTPNLEQLTTDLCSEIIIFINFICENDLVSDYLKDKTTIQNYYEFECESKD